MSRRTLDCLLVMSSLIHRPVHLSSNFLDGMFPVDIKASEVT